MESRARNITEPARTITETAYSCAGILVAVYPVVILLAAENTGLDTGTRVSLGLGYVALSLICLQLILSARVPMLDRVFGSGHLIRIHRVTGVIVLVIVAFHTVTGLFSITETTGFPVPVLPPFGITVSGMVGTVLLGVVTVIGIRQASLTMNYKQWRQLHRIAYYLLPVILLHALLSGKAIAELPLLMYHSVLLTSLAALAVVNRAIRFLRAAQHPLAITGVVSRGPDVTSLRFERPEQFRFLPGQYCEIATSREPMHPYTISSGTGEPDLEITARAIGDFSRSWGRFETGEELIVTGPLGRFTPDRIVRGAHVVLLAGGIGITPFAAMVRSDEFWHHPGLETATLIWSVRGDDEPPLLDEITGVSRDKPLHMHLVVTSARGVHEKLSRSGFPVYSGGRISEAVFTEIGIAGNPAAGSYAICGPTGFVNNCRTLLRNAGVPRNRIFHETFRIGSPAQQKA